MLLSPRKNGLTSLFKEVRLVRCFQGEGDLPQVLFCRLGKADKMGLDALFKATAVFKDFLASPNQQFPKGSLQHPLLSLEQAMCSFHAGSVVLCERTCFCLLSTFYDKNPSKNPSKNLVFTESPDRHLLRTLLRNSYF